MESVEEQKEHLKQVTNYFEELVQIEEGKEVMVNKDYSLLSEEMIEFRDSCIKKQQESLEKLKQEEEEYGGISFEDRYTNMETSSNG